MSLLDEIARLLGEEEFAPFDREVKSLIKKPGVFQHLWNDFRHAEIVRLRKDFEDEVPGAVNGDVRWLSEEYTREQVMFRSDLVADANGVIYHIEQQTKHDRITMLRRMAEYANLIMSFHKFECDLRQVYYYTGSGRVQWDKRIRKEASIWNCSWSLSNRFIFIDSGNHDAHRMLSTKNIDFATLGLLARKIDGEDAFLSGLVDLIYKQCGAGTPAFYSKLVTCIIVGSLRGRGVQVWSQIKMAERRNLPPHERKVIQTWMTISDHSGREIAFEVMSKLIAIERDFGIRFPLDFGKWAVHNITEDQLADMANLAPQYRNVADLLTAAGVIWNEEIEAGLGYHI